MATLGIFDSILVYQFVKRLVRPFKKWPAFKTGVIDDKGTILVPKEKRTDEQNKSFKFFDLLVLNMKKLLSKLPGGASTIATFAAAAMLLKEENILEMDDDAFILKLQEYIPMAELIMEDMAANSLGAAPGNIAGVSDNNPPARTFAGNKVFSVNSDKAWKSRFGKRPSDRYKKFVGEDEEGEEIRQYGRKNPNHGIVLHDRKTGAMMFLRRSKPKLR